MPAVMAPSPQVVAVMNAGVNALVVTEAQRECVESALAGDPQLVAALGADPRLSGRWPDAVKVATSCVNAGFATTWAQSLQRESGGSLTADQLACAAGGASTLSADDIAALARSGLTPGSTEPGIVAKVDSILAGCGIDKSKLARP
jgi:hypothetical protein